MIEIQILLALVKTLMTLIEMFSLKDNNNNDDDDDDDDDDVFQDNSTTVQYGGLVSHLANKAKSIVSLVKTCQKSLAKTDWKRCKKSETSYMGVIV